MITEDARRLMGLQLFKALIKDGCRWDGDVLSKEWSEMLVFNMDITDIVNETLSAYEEGVVWKRVALHDYAIWIA